MLLVPLVAVLYVAILFGVLWVATRVVRHAWYWQPPSASKTSPEEEAPGDPRS